MKKKLVVLTGPTAVGKTKLSIMLAKKLNGEIISADSMQVYKKMNIGSAKIRTEEMEGVRHYLVDILDPKEDFNVVLFQKLAREAIAEITARGHIPILVGGTGFYIQAVTQDIDFDQSTESDDYRKQLECIAKDSGAEYLHSMLRAVDKKSADEIHANNTKRVIRALEYYHETGQPISLHNERERQKETPYDLHYFVLNDKRERLYQRINQRIDEMMDMGLVEEVRMLQKDGCTRNLVSMQGLGYKEMLDYLDGVYTREEAVEILKRDTRHFAKRQLTWFRREKNVIWVNKDEFAYDNEKILEYMMECMNESTDR